MNIIIEYKELQDLTRNLSDKYKNRVNKVIIKTLLRETKKDIIKYAKGLVKKVDKIKENILSKILNSESGVIKAKYIALFHEKGTKERYARKRKYMYFINKEGQLIRVKTAKALEKKEFMEYGLKNIEEGKYNNIVLSKAHLTLQKIIEKEK